jgi:hypothetical protein
MSFISLEPSLLLSSPSVVSLALWLALPAVKVIALLPGFKLNKSETIV